MQPWHVLLMQLTAGKGVIDKRPTSPKVTPSLEAIAIDCGGTGVKAFVNIL